MGGGVTDAPDRLFMKGAQLSVFLSSSFSFSFFFFFSFSWSDLLSLRSSRSKYNASATCCFFVHFDLKLIISSS